MNFIIEHWQTIVGISAIAVVAITGAVKFIRSGKTAQIANLKEWLLYATTLAEKELGGGTGKLKLRYVYDMFVIKFPWLAKIISFEKFSDLVDESLEEMNKLLINNNAVQLYVNGPSEDDEIEAEG